ncbi:AAA family ATPase [Caldibacillus thermoamylovorans]|uniref:AAA family ATPase n=1 Tax=Caldibacillus thermoamylovorans TaxID=35841 RepID=UPI001D08C9F0|nr:AAA family ATPase [Caldibacillus thermoamylovorans]MCB5936619.1 AAA family ATPase [Bacillus sp. DFI.2.34]MCB7078045.1 AAA family ATPase [Caldibacillus thermoamylovorans]
MNKMKDIQNAMTKKYYEREKEIEGLLVALLAKQHILFIGDPGTGKSMLSAELGKIIQGSNYFQWLLSQFTTPEELFGVLSLKELENGVYLRNTDGKLPEANFAFLDEIFKANSAILNALLTLINERIFFNNGSPVQTPLFTLVGSSNEYPEEGEGLEALFDRFLLRYEVEYIKDESAFIKLLKGQNQVQTPTMTLTELVMSQLEVEQVTIPDNVYQTLADIRQDLKDEGIRPSDRRFVQSLSLLRAKAYLEGRQNVILSDVEILKHSLWVRPEQKEDVTAIIRDNAVDHNVLKYEERLREVMELAELLKDTERKVDDQMEVINKLKAIKEEVKNIHLEDQSKIDSLIDFINNEVTGYASAIIDF